MSVWAVGAAFLRFLQQAGDMAQSTRVKVLHPLWQVVLFITCAVRLQGVLGFCSNIWRQ